VVETPAVSVARAGSIRRLNEDSLPILGRISVKRLTTEPGTIREPHRHANAEELTYRVADLARLSRDTGSPDLVPGIGAPVVADGAGLPAPYKFSV
jgi:hypothetical protein